MIVISILVWDQPEYTANLLQSLLSSHRIGRRPHEIWILDQGSAAPTKAVLERYRNRVRILTLEANIGFPAGHNRVYAEAARGRDLDGFCILNSDVVFDEDDWLDRLAGVMEADPHHAIVGPWGVCVIREGEKFGKGRSATEAEMRNGHFDLVSGSLSLIRGETIRNCGLFDEAFSPAYYEDADLNMRYRAAGRLAAYCPIHARHHYRPEWRTEKNEKRGKLRAAHGDFMERNRHLFLERWGEALDRDVRGRKAEG